MARQWFLPSPDGGMIDEDGTEEYFVPDVGQINEDQSAVIAATSVLTMLWRRRRR